MIRKLLELDRKIDAALTTEWQECGNRMRPLVSVVNSHREIFENCASETAFCDEALDLANTISKQSFFFFGSLCRKMDRHIGDTRIDANNAAECAERIVSRETTFFVDTMKLSYNMETAFQVFYHVYQIRNGQGNKAVESLISSQTRHAEMDRVFNGFRDDIVGAKTEADRRRIMELLRAELDKTAAVKMTSLVQNPQLFGKIRLPRLTPTQELFLKVAVRLNWAQIDDFRAAQSALDSIYQATCVSKSLGSGFRHDEENTAVEIGKAFLLCGILVCGLFYYGGKAVCEGFYGVFVDNYYKCG